MHSEDELARNCALPSKRQMPRLATARSTWREYIEEPRHVEFQILADEEGNTIHLGERDCSLQRRHQKIVEEGPCIALTDSLRERMGAAAVAAAKAARYTNAGTVEFLLDKHGNFFFLEMNTRIQVEHPVTEVITGIDLVKAQIAVASGLPLPLDAGDRIRVRGHAIECRSTPENPDRQFAPSVGEVKSLLLPGGPGSGSTRISILATGCPRTMTSCSRSSSAGGRTGMRPWRAWRARWMSSCWMGCTPPSRSTAGSCRMPTSSAARFYTNFIQRRMET